MNHIEDRDGDNNSVTSAAATERAEALRILRRFERMRTAFQNRRNALVVPIRFCGEYKDVFTSDLRLPIADPRDPLALKNFSDDSLNRLVKEFHDRWMCLVNLLKTLDKRLADGSVPVLTDYDSVEIAFLQRVLEQDLNKEPVVSVDDDGVGVEGGDGVGGTGSQWDSFRAEEKATEDIWKRLSAVNKIIARRLVHFFGKRQMLNDLYAE